MPMPGPSHGHEWDSYPEGHEGDRFPERGATAYFPEVSQGDRFPERTAAAMLSRRVRRPEEPRKPFRSPYAGRFVCGLACRQDGQGTATGQMT
jgi:hypothetical protein